MVAFLLLLTVSLSQRSYTSLFRHVKFSYQWNRRRTTQICKLVERKSMISLIILLQVLLSSWRSARKVQLCFLRDLAFHLQNCRIQQKLHERHKICLWLERIRNLLICYTIQQKIHETHKIRHPSEQNYFFVQYFQGVCENCGNSGGEGRVNFGGRYWKIQGGGGQIPLRGSGMDIFWNHTLKILEKWFLTLFLLMLTVLFLSWRYFSQTSTEAFLTCWTAFYSDYALSTLPVIQDL